MKNKILQFAALVQTQTIQRLNENKLACESNLKNAETTVKEGKKFTKVDIGTSGRYMVENETGNIFGIKAYGQVHKGHFYGTVNTTDLYFWGGYYPEKLDGTSGSARGRSSSCPALTFAPEPEPMKTVVNLQSGRECQIPVNTPFCCDPSTETYHSM
jgi:hypothetical protein